MSKLDLWFRMHNLPTRGAITNNWKNLKKSNVENVELRKSCTK